MTVSPPCNLQVLLVRFWRHLSKRRQRQFFLLMLLMLISGFAEVVSLGAVLPFISVLAAPDRVFGFPIIAGLAQSLGINSADQLIAPITIAFVLLALMASVIRILLLWVSTRLAHACGADLSIAIYRLTLHQPFRVHVARNSSEMISGITNKVNIAVNVLYQITNLTNSAVLIIAILFALISIDPIVASVAALLFGVSYGLIAWMSRRRLHVNSQRIAFEQTQVIKALQEGLGGIRDVLLDNTQQVYCDIYRKADLPLRRAYGINAFIAQSPRPALEAIGIALIAILAYSLNRSGGGLISALPTLGALALGAQRLLPALQQGYSAWANIVGSQASLADTLTLLDQPKDWVSIQPPSTPICLQSGINFESVDFYYVNKGPTVISGLHFFVPKGARVGFVGSTGSGKSTTMDLLMGLLPPTRGEILVDGKPIVGEHRRAWQRSIAHVPQSIYLADASIAENIAFGVPSEQIDMVRVRHTASQAQISDFIESGSEGYEANVGERGIRLSGGQRQRIGIARALYKKASVLVFDEATSALDNTTEQLVMQAIEGLGRELTVLIIAHRISTVRRCDFIIEMENGRVVAQGKYEELLERSPSFRRMAATR